MKFLIFLLLLIPLALQAQLIIPEPTIVIAPYDQSPEKESALRFLMQLDSDFTHFDAKLGIAIAPKFKNIYKKNIGYLGLAYRTSEQYQLTRLGLFVDSYQSFNHQSHGNIKTRVNLYVRHHNQDEDIGIGLGAHALFQPKRNLFYSLGFEARPVFLTFDWSDETYFEMDINQELRRFISGGFSMYARWLMVGQFEGSAAITQPINRLSLGLTIQI